MPSYTEEQRCKAIEAAEECGGSVARAMRRPGYPTRRMLCRWLAWRVALRVRKSGRPWSRCDPALKAQVVALVRSGMAGGTPPVDAC